MEQPVEIRLVPSLPIPQNLYVCLAQIKPRAAAFLAAAYWEGKPLPKNLAALHNGHLVKEYELGEKGVCWEGGPSTDFREVLYVFSAGSLEEARGLMQADPFYQDGIFYEDTWFGWSIHLPPWKLAPPMREELDRLMRDVGILPTYPAGVTPRVIEKKVDVIPPANMVVCFSRADVARIKQIEADHKAGREVPAFLIEHFYNRMGPGGTSPMGYDWESGPSDDQVYDLTIYSVGSVEMARMLRDNDRFSRYGLFYDHHFFEWRIFTPFNKVASLYKGVLQRFLEGAGVKPAV